MYYEMVPRSSSLPQDDCPVEQSERLRSESHFACMGVKSAEIEIFGTPSGLLQRPRRVTKGLSSRASKLNLTPNGRARLWPYIQKTHYLT